MAASLRIQTLAIGSQTVSTGNFAAARGGGLVLEGFAAASMPADLANDAARSTQLGFTLEELARAMDARLPTRYTIGGQAVFLRFVKLPPVGDGGQVEKIVEFEAQQNVPFPLAEVIWDYQLFTDPASGEAEVALVAIKADALNQINDHVEDAKIKVTAVDIAPMALLNAFRYNYPDVAEPTLLIDIGARSTNLVFSELGRVFCRTLPVGGATVTQAIAKEFQVPFEMAEEKKIRDGFIALGGAYAEHPDPALAALARVARTAMTRIHSEIVRTVNYYRSQMGGNQPRLTLLCGGGAAMPYTKEFFEEKLAMPVDYFNALRNVAVAERAAATATAMAYRLGEHVGLALRSITGCPMEIELEPDAVAQRREVRERKPLWWASAACVVAGVGALACFGQFAAGKAADMQNGLARELNELDEFDGKIASQVRSGEIVDKERQPLLAAIAQREAWPRLLGSLNAAFASDVLWVTDVEPLKNGEPFLPDLNVDRRRSPTAAPAAAPATG
jgi:type IV pilus assembly protein PilM